MGQSRYFILANLIFVMGTVLPFIMNYNLNLAETSSPLNLQSNFQANKNLLSIYHLTWQILKNNILVGIILSIGGFYSFGLLSAGMLMWNGMVFGSLIKLALYINFPVSEILKTVLIHGPLELFAICCFGAQGLAGLGRLWVTDNSFMSPPTAATLSLPVLILTAAAFMEASAGIFLN